MDASKGGFYNHLSCKDALSKRQPVTQRRCNCQADQIDRVPAFAGKRIEFLPPVLTWNERGRFGGCTTATTRKASSATREE
jgi:hypothetical protein